MYDYKLQDINESYSIIVTDDIEFKKKVIDSLSIYEEGYKFSPKFRAKVWDGKRQFYKILDNGHIIFPKGLVKYIIKDLVKENKKYDYFKSCDDENINKEDFEQFVESLKLPFKPYDYQIEASFNAIKYRRGVFQSATGSGKSLIIYIIIMWMLKSNRRSILVVPTISLTLQMYSDFKDYGIEQHYKQEDIIKKIGGEYTNKDLTSHNVVISTWQSLQYMKKNDFTIFDAIIADECHTVKGDALNNIVNNAVNAKWKIGVTGTVPRTKVDKVQLVGTLGRVFKVITPQGLIDRGLATPVIINMLYFVYSDRLKNTLKEIIKLENNKSKKRKKHKIEEDFINECSIRNDKVASLLNKLASKDENVLSFFTKIDHGIRLLEKTIFNKTGINNVKFVSSFTPSKIDVAFDDWTKGINIYTNTINPKIKTKIYKRLFKQFPEMKEKIDIFLSDIKTLEDLDIYFINGDVEGAERERIRQLLEDNKGVIIIASFGTTSTGINYKNLHHLVLSSSTKSFVRLSQSVGRGMRKHSSKDRVQIWDIVDDITRGATENYALLHSYERLEIYREQGYPINEKEIYIDSV